ncbi:preprotein translocase subunit SecG [bacterium]|nr:preprotein translocase subunit SecG [bacterium]
MFKIVWAAQIISAAFLIILILMHSPKGDGIASIGGMSQVFASQKSAEKGLNKITYIFASIFLISTFILGYIIKP